MKNAAITDCHTHFWRREHWTEEMEHEAALARGRSAQTHVEESEHWQAMAPVGRAIVFGFRARHSGLVVPNELVAAYVRKHPDKLAGFACLDCTEPDYFEQLRFCCEEQGFRGLKLAPTYQNFHPMDERMRPVYEYCEKRGLPVMIHQGATFVRKAPLRYAFPAQLEEVALAYPHLVMVVAHLGQPWISETLVLIRKQPNLYADISALHYRPWQFYNALVMATEYGVASKLLFGSDYPFTTPEESIAGLRNVNAVVSGSCLPRVSGETIQGILERDTFRLLGLE